MVKKNKIFNILFDTNNTHVQLISKSQSVIGLLASEGQLEENDIDLIWNSAKVINK